MSMATRDTAAATNVRYLFSYNFLADRSRNRNKKFRTTLAVRKRCRLRNPYLKTRALFVGFPSGELASTALFGVVNDAIVPPLLVASPDPMLFTTALPLRLTNALAPSDTTPFELLAETFLSR